MKPSRLTFVALLPLLLATFLSPTESRAQATPPAGSWQGESLTEFDSEATRDFDWQVVNDGVMGGLSKGKIQIVEGGLIFSGELSLKNNGGFSTFRSQDIALDLSEDLGILLRVKGDGRTYDLRLSTDATYRSMEASFSTSFPTTAGEWKEIRVPFSEMTASFRGLELKNVPFDPAKITRLGILLGDKKEAPFRLELDWIRTYGTKPGNVDQTSVKAEPTPKPKTLVDAVLADGRFQTLATALTKADLLSALQGTDPLTVFAPTDEAFSKIPQATLNDLLLPENKSQLVEILTYHVVAGNNRLSDALRAGKVATLQGESLEIVFRKGAVEVNEAALLEADIAAPNGVIHVIDSVLFPKPKRNTLLTTAESAGGFTTVLAALEAAGLSSALDGDKPLTLFAPTDEAFAALPQGTVESLLKPGNRDKLTELLTAHVVAGNVSAGDALNAGAAESLSGSTLEFAIEDGRFTVNGSVIRTAGIDAGNGTIHVISSVIGFPKNDGFISEGTSESSLDDEAMAKDSSAPRGAMKPSDLITAAIERGVPLYNSGKISDCADLYEACLETLSKNGEFDLEVREALGKIVTVGQQYDENRRAWFYRHALDRMMHMISTNA